ncbi:MAG: PHP domain-containing protein [Dehalococcoidales bacterium]|jgi:predicted metal-dependent phosphoesterase TrpH
MAKADLHIHSNASDGRYSPAEIVRLAAAANLTVMALTDHDTVDGLEPALAALQEFPALKLIPGVELSTDTTSGEIHMLGYFIDYDNGEFRSSLARMRNSRTERAEKMVAKLKALGCDVELARVKQIAGNGALGRAHVAQALLEKGYISSFKEAFTKYIGRDCPAYVAREKLTPAAAVQLILKVHGLPVLAHPFTTTNPETVIRELKPLGLAGMEVYYAGYLPAETNNLLHLANKYDLAPTGGTDYHGIDPAAEITIGGTDVPMHFIEQFISMAEQRGIKTA